MKNVTLSAPEPQIEAARAWATEHKTTLNQLFRDWLHELSQRQGRASRYASLMQDLETSVRVGGRKFSRDEMNER